MAGLNTKQVIHGFMHIFLREKVSFWKRQNNPEVSINSIKILPSRKNSKIQF